MKGYFSRVPEISLLAGAYIGGVLAYQPGLLDYYRMLWFGILFLVGLVLIKAKFKGFLTIAVVSTGFLLAHWGFTINKQTDSTLIPKSEHWVQVTNKASTSLEWQALYTVTSVERGEFRIFAPFDSEIIPGSKVLIRISNCQRDEQHRLKYCSGKIVAHDLNTGSKLFKLRSNSQQRLYDYLSAILGPRPAGLSLAMVLGVKKFILSSDSKLFQESGLMHILVASGANVIFLVSFAEKFMDALKVNKRVHHLTIFLVIMVYAWFVGPEIPILRASIMVSLLMLARLVGRPLKPEGGLLLAVLIMLLANPLLVYSASFQLTVAGVSCVLLQSRVSRKLGGKIANRGVKMVVSEMMIMPILVVFIMGPILIFRFQEIQISGVLITPVALWLVQILTIILLPLGVVASLLGFNLVPLVIAKMVIMAVEWLQVATRLPSLDFSSITGALIFTYYLTLWLSASTLTRTSDSTEVGTGLNVTVS